MRVERCAQDGSHEKQRFAGLKFEVRRLDEACIVCFVPDCVTPVRYGCSDIDINEETGEIKPAGVTIPSVVDGNGITYRAYSPNGFSYFSSQNRIVVDLASAGTEIINNTITIRQEEIKDIKNEIKEVLQIFGSLGAKALVDDRYMDRVRLYIGACENHLPNLKGLKLLAQAQGNTINKQILAEAIRV